MIRKTAVFGWYGLVIPVTYVASQWRQHLLASRSSPWHNQRDECRDDESDDVTLNVDPIYRTQETSKFSHLREPIRRAFSEFLGVPAAIVAGFLVLAALSYVLDKAEPSWLELLRDYMAGHVFGNPESTGSLLGAIAAGVITVSSITFSILLLAIQQSAAAMTNAVIDQFLRRRFNQVFFGAYIGVAVFSLVTLATVNPPFNPVIGATLALVSSVVSLSLLPLLIYKTIDQTRPAVITTSIHDHLLSARQRQLDLIGGTRRRLHRQGEFQAPILTTEAGYVTRIDLDAINACVINTRDSVEVEISVPIGTYVASHDTIMVIHGRSVADVTAVADRIAGATTIESQRDLKMDPAYGIEQLHMIAWTSVSTSKSNPSPGLYVIRALRDILAQWAADKDKQLAEPSSQVVYHDNTVSQLMGTLESLAVVSTESMQHQSMAEVIHGLSSLFNRLPDEQQSRAADVMLRSLAGLGDHVLTLELELALGKACDVLRAGGFAGEALAIEEAAALLGQARGKLNSRSTRVPTV